MPHCATCFHLLQSPPACSVANTGVSDVVGTECMLPPSGDSTHLAMFAPKGVGVCSKEAGNAVSDWGRGGAGRVFSLQTLFVSAAFVVSDMKMLTYHLAALRLASDPPQHTHTLSTLALVCDLCQHVTFFDVRLFLCCSMY